MGKILEIKHPDISGQPTTTLTTTEAAADTSLAVVNTTGFTASKYLLIGGYNSPTSEIKLGGAITATTLATAATSFEHIAGTVVSQIPYNKIEIDYSTNLKTLWDSGLYETLQDASDAATWSNLATPDISPNNKVTTYKDDSTASRAYRYRYKNSTDTVYSDYVSIIFPDGFYEKQVSSIFEAALDMPNKEIVDSKGGQITTKFLIRTLNEGLRFIDQKRKRWSHNQEFEGVISEITAGKNSYALPSNIEVRDTNRSVWNLRIVDDYNLVYIDKREMDIKHQGWHNSQLAAQLTNLSTTATFDDTSNFADSGTFDVWTGTTHDVVEYSANNRTTNVLTLVDAATDVTTTHAIDQNVWQGASFGTPSFYTIYDGNIVFDLIPDDSMHQRNIDADYYLKTQQVTSEDEFVRIGDPNILINYLRWGISMKAKVKGDAADYMTLFREQLNDLKKIETTGQVQSLVPSGWSYRTQYKARRRNLNNDN